MMNEDHEILNEPNHCRIEVDAAFKKNEAGFVVVIKYEENRRVGLIMRHSITGICNPCRELGDANSCEIGVKSKATKMCFPNGCH